MYLLYDHVGRKTKELGLNEISISLIIVVAVSCSDGGSSGAVAVEKTVAVAVKGERGGEEERGVGT